MLRLTISSFDKFVTLFWTSNINIFESCHNTYGFSYEDKLLKSFTECIPFCSKNKFPDLTLYNVELVFIISQRSLNVELVSFSVCKVGIMS